MAYLTPPNLPEDDDCRPLFIPRSSEWLALFGGAFTELTKTWNWEDSGGLTVEETVTKMQEILDRWYGEICSSCTTPGGYKIVRIGDHGQLEELGDDGEWTTPTGDYVIPPPDAREGGTVDDQICLAAENAVNAVHTLYSSLSDSFASTLSAIEAFDAMVGVATIYFGFTFAPITYGIYAFLSAIFQGVYLALSYLTADLWTDNFSRQIECFLIDCATNDAGVVTFDWDCFMSHLNSLANDFSLTETQIRLYIQFGFILQFLGGADALNLAGGTTEITSADCECDCIPDLVIQAGWGTLTYEGNHHYRITSVDVGGVQRIAFEPSMSSPSTCWYYTGFTLDTYITYVEHRQCDCTTIVFALPADGFSICKLYIANEDNVPMEIEFDAYCYEG